MSPDWQAPKEQANHHGRPRWARVLQQVQRHDWHQTTRAVNSHHWHGGEPVCHQQGWRRTSSASPSIKGINQLSLVILSLAILGQGRKWRKKKSQGHKNFSSPYNFTRNLWQKKKEQPRIPWCSPLLLNIMLFPLWYTISNQFILSPLLTELLFSDVQSYLNQGWTLLQMVTIPKYIIFVHRLFSVFGYFSLGWARLCHLISLHFKDKKLEYELNTEISSCYTTGEILFWDGNLNHKLPGNSIISQLGSPAHSKM